MLSCADKNADFCVQLLQCYPERIQMIRSLKWSKFHTANLNQTFTLLCSIYVRGILDLQFCSFIIIIA